MGPRPIPFGNWNIDLLTIKLSEIRIVNELCSVASPVLMRYESGRDGSQK